MHRMAPIDVCSCVVLLACAAGCNGQLTPQGRQLLNRASASLSRGDYGATLADMDRFLHEHGSSRAAGRAHYLRGKARLGLNDRKGARKDLAEALDRSRERDVRINAGLALGDLAFEEGHMATAEQMYRDVISEAETGKPPLDHARYRLGCVLQRRGKWLAADLQFNRVVEYFPGTELARRGARRLHARGWTVQAGAFSDKSRADALARRLKTGGCPADVTPVLSAGRPLFLVVVGRYNDYEQAGEVLGSVRKHQADAFVTVR